MSEALPQQIASIDTLFLDIPPSCIEFWDVHPEYFVLGTYFLKNPEGEQEQGELQEESPSKETTRARKPQERTGSLVLCKLNEIKIEIVDTCETEFAILDLHFEYEGNGDERKQMNVLWTANSTGSIAAYDICLSELTGKPTIERKSLCQLYPEDILVLSFCWHPSDSNLMSTTLSNGEVHVLWKESKTHDGRLSWKESTQKLVSHELEAWTSCFSSMGEELLFSGGDDAVLQYTNTPSDFHGEHEQDHEYGLSFVLENPHSNHQLTSPTRPPRSARTPQEISQRRRNSNPSHPTISHPNRLLRRPNPPYTHTTTPLHLSRTKSRRRGLAPETPLLKRRKRYLRYTGKLYACRHPNGAISDGRIGGTEVRGISYV